MIFLDTHVVAWLFAGLVEKFGEETQTLLNGNELAISPVVRLELQYLHEIERITVTADEIISDLSGRLGLQVVEHPFNGIISQALKIDWTRDPFDRLIVATAALQRNVLVSKDRRILNHYSHAHWA